MTTNQDRAAEVIGQAYQQAMESDTPSAWRGSIAQALADAGLLTPDLPEPEDIDRFPGSKCWQLSPYRSPRPSSHVAVRLTHDDLIKVNLTGELDSPLQLREVAAALLAAAAHTHQEKK